MLYLEKEREELQVQLQKAHDIEKALQAELEVILIENAFYIYQLYNQL